MSAGELQKQIHGLHNESWGNKLNVLLPVVDRNERRNPLDHFNEELCKNSLSPSPSLSLFTEKVQAWSLQSWWYLLWWKMVNTFMNFAFFYTSGTTLASDHPTQSALVTIRTWIIYLNKSINSFPKKRATKLKQADMTFIIFHARHLFLTDWCDKIKEDDLPSSEIHLIVHVFSHLWN